MSEVVVCKICEKRRAKRACPAVQGDICAICCGEQREVTLSCPLECPFLIEAHKHARPLAVSGQQVLHGDVEISENFIRAHEELLLFCVYSLVQSALRTAGAVDSDVLQVLNSLIQTHRTAESGLIYETRPDNLVAASLQSKFSEALKNYQAERQKRETVTPHSAIDMFKIIVFLHRMGQQNLNGRPKGRMYIDILRQITPDIKVDERAPSIIL